MIRHILKIIWKQKRSYFAIFIEQVFIAVILMLSAVAVTEAVEKYRMPGLLDVENTFYVGYMFNANIQPDVFKSARQNMDVIIDKLRKLDYVEAVSSGYNLVPYLRNDFHYYSVSDSIHIDDKHFQTIIKISDEFGADVLKPDIEEGKWIENNPLPDGSAPLVITRQFADKAGWKNAVGKKVTIKSHPHTVVGVVAGLKQEPLILSPVAVVIPQYLLQDNGLLSENVVRIKPGMEEEFMKTFYREFNRLISDENVEPLFNNIQTLKGVWLTTSLINIVLQSIPTIFLLLFSFIGTFGLYWMISRKRLKEFALRIALGSTKRKLMSMVIGESLFIMSISLIPALVLSFFIYEYMPMHFIAVGFTVFIMFLFSFISAWFPAWKVSRLNPAEVLKYE
ncbi:MAG: ABC transporter permease [Candidatus Azobacteroides sp.]|nr:ABC transporter permease [Candidatus Azobacteroides sp.]